MGLVAIVSKEKPEVCKEQINRMVRSIVFDGNTKTGCSHFDDMGLYIGWAYQEHRAGDCYPIKNETEDTLLFLSEGVPLYHDDPDGVCRDRSSMLSGAAHLIHLYHEHGLPFLSELNGQYSGILVDLRFRCAFIFNDAFGIKRLFVNEKRDVIHLSSKARPILTVLRETQEHDPVGISEFLTCGCTVGSRSLYKDISILPCGSVWTIKKGQIETKNKYFNYKDWEDQEELDHAPFFHEVQRTLPAVIQSYGKATVPVGISLTGGLDTRMIVAGLNMEIGEYPCYTFGSMYRDTFDVILAKRIAENLLQRHEVIVLGQDFLKDLPYYLEKAVLISDGYIGVSGAAEYFANIKARMIAPIRLTGNYGGELLRGVRTFKSALPKSDYVSPELRPYLRQAVEVFKTLETMNRLSFSLFVQAPNMGYGRSSVEESQVIIRTPFLDRRIVRLLYQRSISAGEGTELSKSIIFRHKPCLMNIPTDRGELGTGNFLAKLFRHIYYEALFKGEYWSTRHEPRWAKSLTSLHPSFSPRAFFRARHKYQHFHEWLSKDLSFFIRDVFFSYESIPDALDKARIQAMVKNYLAGNIQTLDEIEKTLTLILGSRLLFR